MTLYFEEEGDVKLPLECEALAKRVVEEALDYVGCPYEAGVRTQSDARICFSYCAFCVTLNRL